MDKPSPYTTGEPKRDDEPRNETARVASNVFVASLAGSVSVASVLTVVWYARFLFGGC